MLSGDDTLQLGFECLLFSLRVIGASASFEYVLKVCVCVSVCVSVFMCMCVCVELVKVCVTNGACCLRGFHSAIGVSRTCGLSPVCMCTCMCVWVCVS